MGNKVVWLIGLSGAGKTTIAEAACERYGAELLDGDTIRDFFSNQDFSKEGKGTTPPRHCKDGDSAFQAYTGNMLVHHAL